MKWPMVKLADVCQVNPRLPNDCDESQEISFLAMASISEDGVLLNQEMRTLSETKKGFTYFERGDVILAKITPCFENGKAAYLDSLKTTIGFGSTEFHVLRPDVEQLDGKYWFYLVWNKKFRFIAERSMSGSAGQKRVPTDFLKNFNIPLPPLEEQKRIVAILDKAYTICQKRQQAIALADDFLRSVFLDMFGDPVTNPKGCKLIPMTEVFHIKTGKLNSNAEVKSGVYPFFTCAKEVYRIDHYAFDQEALLLAGNNAQADYDVKHYIGKFNAYQRTYVLSLKNENWSYPFFKFALEFQLSNLKNSSKGSNTKYITMEIMSRTMLPSPSPSDQSEFAAYFNQQMDMRNILDKSQQESNALFNSLSQKAFSGQL